MVNDRFVWFVEKTNLLLPIRAVFVNKEALSTAWYASKHLLAKLKTIKKEHVVSVTHLESANLPADIAQHEKSERRTREHNVSGQYRWWNRIPSWPTKITNSL